MSASGGSGSGAVTFAASPSNVCTISGSTLTGVGNGTCTITATKASSGTYLSASATAIKTFLTGTSCGSTGKWKKFTHPYPSGYGFSTSNSKVYGPYGNNNRDKTKINNVCGVIGSGWRMPTNSEMSISSELSSILVCAPSGQNEIATSTMNGGVSVYHYSGGGVSNKTGTSSSSNKGDIILCYKP